MFTMHRQGELAIEIPLDIENQGEAAVEQFVADAHAEVGCTEAYLAAVAYRDRYWTARHAGKNHAESLEVAGPMPAEPTPKAPAPAPDAPADSTPTAAPRLAPTPPTEE